MSLHQHVLQILADGEIDVADANLSEHPLDKGYAQGMDRILRRLRRALEASQWEKDGRRTVVLDFDGVLHSYWEGWKGDATVIQSPPVDGAREFVTDLVTAGYRLCVFSCRSFMPGGIDAMRQWLEVYDFPVESMEFPVEKVPGLILDDHAIPFRGKFPSLEEIASFRTWQDYNDS